MKDWNKTMEINYGGVVRGTMLALKYMGTPFGGKGGTVVQTASIAGLMSNIWIAPMYRSTKRAVVEYTRAVGDPRTFQHFNVRIMAICPGFTDTPLLEGDRVHQHLIKEFYEVAQKFANNFTLQSPESVGKSLIEILQQGSTGDIWVVENDENPRLANLPVYSY